jgi:hypothetical protein
MALGKTITYTPFQETSFAYGATELATNYSTEFPNSDDTVKIIIEHTSGNWDETGHISTPSSGTAISFYNKGTDTWTVTGERDDVDAVLSQLKFFPADHPQSRPKSDDNTLGFQVLRFKQNQTNGSYTNENPPVIGDTVFSIKAYDGSDVQQVSQTLTFDPTEPTYGNKRPYFSTEPATDDYSASSFDSSDGNLLDFGTINHGYDTENVTVTVYFRNYSTADLEFDTQGNLNTSSFISSNELGQFLNLSDIYINDKKASELDDDSLFKFEFTGSLKECQTFIDNIKYKTKGTNQQKTFQMVVTVDDGAVGSALTKTMWHDKTLSVGVLPNQSFKEDTTTKFDLGDVDFDNKDDLLEVTSYKAVITLDSTGQGGATSFGTTTNVATNTYSSGVLTIIDSNFNTLKTAVRNLEFVPLQDFADDFTFTVQFTFENTTIGSSYTHTAKTVNVTAQEQAEAININVTHNWNEDQVYYFKTNRPLQIIHPYNETFDVSFDLASLDKIGDIDTTSTASKTKTIRDNIITFNGTRDNLNSVLQNLRFIPNTDYDQSFDLDVTITRKTGGNLANADITTGTLTMRANAQEEYSHTQPAKITWQEDVSRINFSTGIRILDTSLDDPLLPAYGGKFKMSLRAKYVDGTAVSTDDITWSCFNSTNCTVSGSGTVADPLIITGDRADMNISMNSLRMIPAADFTATQDFYFEYKLERGEFEDDFYAVYVDYTKSVKFDKGTPSDEFTTIDEYKFGIDRITSLDGYTIVDRAVEKEYQLKFTVDDDGEGRLRAIAHGDATVDWNSDTKVLELTGNKEDINFTLLSLEFLPSLSFNTDFKIYYYQKQTTDNIIQADGTAYFDMTFDSSLLPYELDTGNDDIFYAEDLLEQRNLLSFTKLKNLDAAAEITDEDIYYVTTLRLSPTNLLYFSYDYAQSGTLESDVLETRASEITFTGSRDYCNSKIRNLVFSAYPDQFSNVNLHYTQERWVGGKFESVQANDVTALTLRGQNVGEAVYSPFKQYFTTEDAETVTGEIATPRYLQEYLKVNGLPKNQYSLPINIIDNASEPEGETLYKIEVMSSTLPSGMSIDNIGYSTKEQITEKIQDGIRLVASETLLDTLQHGQEYKVWFRLTRKLPSGTEAVIEENYLTYEYVSKPVSFVYNTSRFDNYQKVEFLDELSFSTELEYLLQDGSARTQDAILQDVRNRKYWGWGYRQNVDMVKGGILYKNSYPIVDVFEREITRQETNTGYDGTITNVTDENFKIVSRSGFIDTPQSLLEGRSVFYRRFNVKEFGQKTKGTFIHEVETSWGLKGSLKVNYTENLIKYSEHMSHIQTADDYIIPCFGHDTAGLNGSWHLDHLEYELNAPSIDDTAPVTLCSHFWVSQQKYAFGFIDSNDDPNHIEYPFDGDSKIDMYNGIRNFPTDKRYICTPKWDKRMRTPNNFIWSNFTFSQNNPYGFAARNLYTGWDRGQKYKNSNAQNVVDEFVDFRTSGSTTEPQKENVRNHGNYKNYINPTISANYFNDPNRWGFSGYTLMANFYDGRYGDFDANITGQSYYYNMYKESWNLDLRAYAKNSSEPGYADIWFDDISSILGSNDIDRSNVRFDIQVSQEIREVMNRRTDNEVIFVPTSVLLVRSYFYQGKTYNEAVKISPFSAGARKFKTVKDGTSEYNMWARRNTKDNTSRILPVSVPVQGDGIINTTNTSTAFILPTGEYWHPVYGLTDFANHPLFNINRDLRGRKIDKFIQVGNDKIAYVSVSEGKIDDGNGAIDFNFDNTLTSNQNYNYVYVTQEPNNMNNIYLMMAYLDQGNTYDSDANTLRSRLVYVDLD